MDELNRRDVPLEEEEPGLIVRPYALTGGRTRSTTQLPLETLVSTTEEGEAAASRLAWERQQIAHLCLRPISVAEISAHLHVPIGVARVLVGDMTEEGLVEVHKPREAGRPDIDLLERVL